MTLGEFVEANNRLETYYGKEYTTEQRQIMFEELKNFSLTRYKRLISQCIRSCKYLPKVVDIINANMEITDTENKNAERKKYECSKCNGTGYVFYSKIIQDGNSIYPYSFAARCTCENAIYANQKIPTYQELGIEVSNSLNQVRDLTRDISEIRKRILKEV